MSNEPTIEQMNEVIGVFIGYKMYNKRYPRNHGIGAPEMEPEKCMIIQNAKYHLSWNWLMPCWGRFREVVADHFNEEYPAEYCAMCDIWALECEHVNINGAHKLLYDAIQWYNKQRSKEKEVKP